MKRNLILLAACGGMLLAANQSKAQETVVVDEVTTIDVSNVQCKDIFAHDWRSNWFIQLGAGAHMPYVEDTRFNSDWKNHFTAIYNVGVGHWWSPYFGFRFNGMYSAMHYRTQGQFDGWGKAKTASLNLEVMWDMLNSICGYKDRVFSIIPFAGVGGSFTWDYTDDSGVNAVRPDGTPKRNVWTLPVSAGIQLRFRLCKYVDFFAEGRFMFYSDEWNRIVVDRPFDIDCVALGGFNINFGGREFESYNPCDYIGYINALNQQVNDLRGALATTAAALAACEAQLPCPEVQEAAPVTTAAPMLSCVRFKINSARVSNEEMVNVYNVSEWMKANPNTKVIIRGYADRDTGTSEYNMKLSERRAQTVKDLLVNQYGIDASRLKTENYGSDVQPFEVNNWNRIVLFAE